jgi:hypothetical protein
MYSALVEDVEIELVIEEKRSELFAKLTDGGYSRLDNFVYFPSNTFTVQKIEPVDDGFVFQVVYDYNVHFYYAFKHKEYIFCPAFLYKFFDLEDYSCLVVKNGIDFEYIILKSVPNNPLLLISDNYSKLLKGFKFFFPSYENENKILSLELSNKDIPMSLIKENLNRYSQDLIEEFYEETPISDLLYISKKDSNYVFIRKDVIIELKTKYGDIFNCFENKGKVLLHSNSAAAKKAREIVTIIIERPMVTSLSNAFRNTDYLRENYILDELIKVIGENYKNAKNAKDSSYNSCMFGIFQSSGYGKSRLIERLGTRIPTFYSSLQHHGGYPKSSVFLRMLIEKLHVIIKSASFSEFRFLNNIATATYVYILRVIYLILIKKKGENQSLSQFLDIDEELEDTPLIPKLPNQSIKEREEFVFNVLFKNLKEVCLYKESINYKREKPMALGDLRCWKSENPLQLTSDLNKFSIDENVNNPEVVFTNHLEEDVMKLLENFQTDKSLPCVFVIDEAQCLLYRNLEIPKALFSQFCWCLKDIDFGKKEPKEDIIEFQSPYSVFRRVFNMFSGIWERLMLVNVSSCREIIIPLKWFLEDHSWNCYGPPKFLKNFILLQTYNVNSMIIPEIKADMFQKRIYQLRGEAPIKDWNEFLESNFRLIKYFKFGRPLAYGIFKDLEEKNVLSNSYNLEAAYQDCCEFKYLAKKLSGGMGYLNDETADIHCLYSMFNFAFGTNYLPCFLNRVELVENYMMTVVKYILEDDTKILEQMQFSEEEKRDRSRFLVGGFLPEGAINFLSARYFAKFPKSLSKILNTCLKNGICNDKSYAELITQVFALSAIFFHINCDLEQVRKLAFQPISLGNFIRKFGEGSIEGGELNSRLEKALMSFGYFEHFSKTSMERPFDLMARCLFRGSALTLNQSFSPLNLMFPLVLDDGRISFVGIKLIYEWECFIEENIQRAVEKMNFYKIFGYHSDRPFAMIILILCDSNPQIQIVKPFLNVQNPLDNPNIVILKGISNSLREHSALFEIAPMGIMYGGIEEGDLEECDHMHGLFREFPPQLNNEN